MNTDPAMFYLLVGLLSLLAFWILNFTVFARYRVEATRQRLFQVRDDLFDYAADGNISFSHPAYIQLRRVINAQIRFCDRMSLPVLVMLFATAKRRLPLTQRLQETWKEAQSDISADVAKQLDSFRGKAHLVLFTHVLRSPLAWIPVLALVLLLLAVAAFAALTGRKPRDTQRKVQERKESTLLAVDAAALAARAA